MIMFLNPYLTFEGNCREAMTFYKDCLGGELTMQTVGESPACKDMPSENQEKIMHAALMKNGTVLLMASDDLGPEKVVRGNNISLSLQCTSDEEINSLFPKLAEGGKITMPLAEQFWGGRFGMLTDQFGMNWMMNHQKTKK